MKAVLFAGAAITDYSFCEKYLQDAGCIICCDGGMHHAKALGITPDYIVGDFDSVRPEVLEEYRNMGISHLSVSYPQKKQICSLACFWP